MRTIACALALALTAPCLAQGHTLRDAQPAVVATIATGGAPCGGAVAGGAVWVGTDPGRAVFRIDPRTNRVRRLAVAAGSPAWFAPSARALWVAARLDGTVLQLDVGTGKVLRRV